MRSRIVCVASLLLTLMASAQQKPPIPSIGETIEVSLVNLDVFVTDISNRTAQRASTDREFCSRAKRALDWALDPKVSALAQVPPPFDLGPEMNIFPCPGQ